MADVERGNKAHGREGESNHGCQLQSSAHRERIVSRRWGRVLDGGAREKGRIIAAGCSSHFTTIPADASQRDARGRFQGCMIHLDALRSLEQCPPFNETKWEGVGFLLVPKNEKLFPNACIRSQNLNPVTSDLSLGSRSGVML